METNTRGGSPKLLPLPDKAPADARDLILAPLEVWGVDAFLDTKVTIKLRIKTVPLKQWDVGRELRRRILRALEQNDIPLTPAPTRLYVAKEDG